MAENGVPRQWPVPLAAGSCGPRSAEKVALGELAWGGEEQVSERPKGSLLRELAALLCEQQNSCCTVLEI